MTDKIPKHGRIKPKYKPKPDAAQERFHSDVRDMGCLVCGRPASIHHVTSDGFKRLTKNHWHVTPLCPEHHQGPKGIHGKGGARHKGMKAHDIFIERYDIDLNQKGLEILENYQR